MCLCLSDFGVTFSHLFTSDLIPSEQCSNCEHVESWRPSESVPQATPPGKYSSISLSNRKSISSFLHPRLFCPYSRWTYEEFFTRYRVLLRGSVSQDDVRRSCQSSLPYLIPDPEQYCFGKTKVFFRAGQVAVLEKLRGDRLCAAGVLIQSWVRGWLERRRYQRLRWATFILQRYTRGTLARRWVRVLPKEHTVYCRFLGSIL